MIKYTFNCASGGQFEAWFRSSAECDAQLEARQVACPTCGSVDVSKALMAPNIAPSARKEPSAPAADAPRPPAPAQDASPAPEPTPSAELVRRAVEERLRALRAMIEANADPVGDAFAEEARRIHDGEAESRAIYGDATADELEALAEDGVPFARVPWVDRRDN